MNPNDISMEQLLKENKELQNKIDKMKIEMGKMNAEITATKKRNEELSQRIQYLEQCHVSKSEFDSSIAQITNAFETLRQAQTSLFKMMEMTTHTIGNEELEQSVVSCNGLFESLSSPTSSFLPDEYVPFEKCQLQFEKDEKEYQQFMSNQYRQNQTNQQTKPVLTDSVIVENLNDF